MNVSIWVPVIVGFFGLLGIAIQTWRQYRKDRVDETQGEETAKIADAQTVINGFAEFSDDLLKMLKNEREACERKIRTLEKELREMKARVASLETRQEHVEGKVNRVARAVSA